MGEPHRVVVAVECGVLASTRKRVEALGAGRLGVVTREQLLRVGVDSKAPTREVEAGRWVRLLPRVYLTEPGPPTFLQNCHAALLYGGENAVVSGNAGCRLHGSPGAREMDARVDLLVPRRGHPGGDGACRVFPTRARPEVSLLRFGDGEPLAVASLDRCVADAVRLATRLSDARAVACGALRSRQLDWEGLAAAARRPGVGGGFLAQVVRDIQDGIRSPAEGDLHDALFQAAQRGVLPPYLLNPELYVDGVFLGSPDAWIVGLGLGDEMDSRQWHESTDLLDATLRRHEAFARAGLHLNHTTPARFRRDPAGHVAKLAALVAERSALALPEPPGLVVLARGPLLPARTPWPGVIANRGRMAPLRTQEGA